MAQFIDFGDGANGSIASASGTINSYSAMTGTAASTQVNTNLSVAQGDYILLIQMYDGTVIAGTHEMVRVATTSSGKFFADRPLTNTYTGTAQAIRVPRYLGGTLTNTITGKSWNGSTGGIIALLVNGVLTNSGAFSIPGATGATGTGSPAGATGGGYRGGNGDAVNTDAISQGVSGEGTAGGRLSQQTARGNGGGGGRHQDNPGGASGGGGGNGSVGIAGGKEGGASNTGGAGGEQKGNSGLTVMVMGGGGGGAAKEAVNTIGAGGSGGGIVFIIAKEYVNTTGATRINVNGGNGGSAFVGGGAGAGGSVLIKCQKATLGTNLIASNGGDGGGSAGGTTGNGGTGRVHLDYRDSYTGSASNLTVTQDLTLNDPGGGAMIFFV